MIEHLRGDVAYMGRLVHLLAAVLVPNADVSALLGSKTEEELRAALAAVDIAGLDVQ